jgi:glycosyltransferase involved in cell wall biosynthesis
VEIRQDAKVAVLLATYNGARFIEPQIRSLRENATLFTLHWLDDHSTDNTREALHASVLSSGIDLREWHHLHRQGFPGAFLQLLECVDADIYLFCDQDDIWQPGKIDATVANLLPVLASSTLCFSDPLVFNDDQPESFRHLSDIVDAKGPAFLEESKLFTFTPAMGHTVGFTRSLREIFLRHKDIARAYAVGHDWWMYLIAASSGTPRMLSNVPTTLWRRHGNNWTAAFYRRSQRGVGRFLSTWTTQQARRRLLSRQATGFVLASATLTPGPKLERLLTLARLVSTLNRRQSPAELVRLMRHRAMGPTKRVALGLAAICLCSDANA